MSSVDIPVAESSAIGLRGVWKEKKPPRGLGPPFPQNFLTALTVGKGLWAEVSSSAEQLKQRYPGDATKIQRQQEELRQRWGQLEALKQEKAMQLARSAEVHSFLQECGPTQIQLQDVLLQLEALQPGSSEDTRRTLQLAQKKTLMLERRVHLLQRVVIKYGQCSGGTGRQ
ncbi:Spectrin beta chain, non-erythrocytic 5 [Saguinus oedipus]|uniref:Spectrin beta chain, non-erythrocytic 5 n=1 Tax=Saguinus oedipus TaxID=9490 RepID=A0ABQ9V303_SAGOE|nr:Spectrin beta chain, non-erythrocytic 5 [Saguinus oedipus]